MSGGRTAKTAAEPARPVFGVSGPLPAGPVLAVAGLSLAGVLLVLLGTSKYGPGLWPDGTNLLWSAKSLVAGKGFLSASGQPMTAWPPLFPALAALPGLAGIEPWPVVRFLNAAAFGLTVFLSGLVFLRLLSHRSLALVGTAAIFLSHPLAAVSVMAWPETVFYLLALVFLLSLGRLLVTWSARSLALTALVTAAAALTHYSGASLVLAGVAGIFILGRAQPLRRRAGFAAVLAASGLVPLLAWLARNVRLTGSLAGQRVPITRLNFLEGLLTALREWFFPPGLTEWLGVVGLIIAAGLALFLSVAAWRATRATQAGPALILRAGVVWLGSFALVLLLPEPPMNFDPIPDRVLVPAFVMVVVLLFFGLDRLSRSLARRLGNALVPELIVLALALVWVSYPLTHVSRVYGEWIALGAGGYNADQWRSSPTVRALASVPQPESIAIYSNEPLAIRLLARRDAKIAPRRTDNIPEFRRSLGSGTACLVWFAAAPAPYLYSPEELGRMLALERIQTFPDAAVYSMRAGLP